MGDTFWVAKFSNIFWGAWNSWYILGWTVDAGTEPTYEEQMTVPPPPPPPPGTFFLFQNGYFSANANGLHKPAMK